MSDKTKKWIKAAGVRAVKTMAQTAVSLITVGNLITELDWVSIIGISATAGVVSMLTSVAGLPEVEEQANADIAYFCKDWDKYRGCRIENTCAKEYGIKVMESEEE